MRCTASVAAASGVVVALALAAGRQEAPGKVTLSELAWLAGHWQGSADGVVSEELWLAPKLEVGREIDLAGFAAAVQKMLGGGTGLGQGYEESETYRTLRSGGYPLRQVLFFVGEKSTLEVTAVAVQQFSETDFAVPKGLTKVGYVELLFGEAE